MSIHDEKLYSSLEELNEQLIGCTLCPRLTEYRQLVALKRPKRYTNFEYWAKPLPGFGDRNARILIVGLAPAAHGGNRTGRVFTGDGSADTLMKALHKASLANKPTSVSKDDGLELYDCYVTAAVKCVPPENKPLKTEVENCFPYLLWEFRLLKHVRVLVALGRLAFDVSVRLLRFEGYEPPHSKPNFGHGKHFQFRNVNSSDMKWLVASYHPSRQNTQTGRLTQRMLNFIFLKARKLAGI